MSKIYLLNQTFAEISDYTSVEELATLLENARCAMIDGSWREIYFNNEIYYDSSSASLVGKRLETDQEFKDRLAKEAKEKIKKSKQETIKAEKEKAEYERLKKKFEG